MHSRPHIGFHHHSTSARQSARYNHHPRVPFLGE
jgi:hypothetical protein